MGKTIIFGDIHGCLDEWQDLIKKINPAPDDLLVSVGDLICKGPQSLKTIEFARSMPNLKCVLGNHELHFLKAWKSGNLDSLSKDYQKRALKEFGSKLTETMQWISAWPLYLDLPDCLVVHGGILPDTPIEKQKADTLCNLRNLEDGTAWHEQYRERKPVVYGHWARQGLCVKENSIGLDSGCVYGKELSAVIFPGTEIVQVKARKAYQLVGDKKD